MYYTYVLVSLNNKRLYVGYTSNVKRRINEHNSGDGGMYTRYNRPFKLVHYEAFLSKEDATKQENFYKSGYGRELLKEKIKGSLEYLG